MFGHFRVSSRGRWLTHVTGVRSDTGTQSGPVLVGRRLGLLYTIEIR
jgi:hypothetical protein